MSDCPTCVAIVCDTGDDTSLYSLQSEIFPFVLNCPSGYDCNEATSFNMLCCNRLLTTQFGPNFTVDDKATAINQLVNQCAAILPQCGENPTCDTSPCPPLQLYYNQPQRCQMPCPDGTLFTYTVVAGTFASTSQATADQQALDYACQQALARRICLSNVQKCVCVGSAYSSTVFESGGIGPFQWSITSGSLPPGTLLNSSTGLISGTPTTHGTYVFTVRVTSLVDGSYNEKPLSIVVLEITTTSLTDYTVGIPYSMQLVAAGGSGNYAWEITSGTLPDGLSMSITGLISGTPTGGAGFQPIAFKVIDTSCEEADQSFFPPSVRLVTSSTTRIATVLGYPEYIPSTPPKKYKKLTWTGTAEQTSVTLGTGERVSDALYVYSGVGEINDQGVQVSNYDKNLFTPCPSSNFTPPVNSIPNFGLSVLKGYCWSTDPASCVSCSNPPQFKQNEAGNFISDEPYGLLGVGPDFRTLTPTTLSNVGGQNVVVSIAGVSGVPEVLNNGFFGAWLILSSSTNYQATLSDEYTDAIALTNAQTINSNGATAENMPRTTGFVSRYTTVSFDLKFSNLIVGQSYVASVSFFTPFPASTTIKNYSFVASADTYTIHDTVPTPPPGSTTTVRSPRVAFVP